MAFVDKPPVIPSDDDVLPLSTHILLAQAQAQAQQVQLEQSDEVLAAVNVPDAPVAPSPERVARDVSGDPLVSDEVVANLSLSLSDPNRRIRQIALATDAKILGSIPETRTYQLQFKVKDFRALDNLQEIVETIPGVDSAIHQHLMDWGQELSRIPNDAGLGSWNIAKPSGNNKKCISGGNWDCSLRL